MIVVRLYGGLGNQLFQYSTGRRLAEYVGEELVLDIGNLGHNVSNITTRQYELWRYPICARTLSSNEVKFAKLYTNKLLKRLPLPRPWLFQKEKYFQFNPDILESSGSVYLDGYWQSPKYFESIKKTLRTELTPIEPMGVSDQITAKIISETNSVAIHVRRGDYVSVKSVAQTHGICSLDYYHSAIELMNKHVRTPTFFVFSDDPDWVQENLKTNLPIEYVNHNGSNNAFQDVRLISLCQHQVIANSSFSWWGAWLNPNPKKLVVAPKKWFLDVRDTSDMCPKNWIRL
jgi:hypothetical protein